jgi:hypothetical protein
VAVEAVEAFDRWVRTGLLIADVQDGMKYHALGKNGTE